MFSNSITNKKSGTEHFHALVPDADADFQSVKTIMRGLSIHISFL